MSDEYHNSGFEGSLVNDSANRASRDSTYKTGNYPPPGDSTSSGGYGSRDTFSDPVQRGRQDIVNNSSQIGLVNQSVNGGPIGGELQDAQQGQDESSRREYRHEVDRDFDRRGSQGLNPYGVNIDSKEEAGEMLASQYADARSRQFESGPARGNDGDVGAL
ncbi:hypothetical protein WOLCODRAFT_147179 [Wolfiporia cocos MD-104 SS10]|uniref:Uncharacterized protein n=1 Tax=Wolfiporia cocos (strain MD-104) TaxID=742152 RepID=A0A2H3ISV6_WOLCO|nr:hypothetical protein WOLCODRAFT_147179 [Wolfiporia cocos MD-104 SS10]